MGSVNLVDEHTMPTLLFSATAVLAGAFVIHISAGKYYVKPLPSYDHINTCSYPLFSHVVLPYHLSPTEGYRRGSRSGTTTFGRLRLPRGLLGLASYPRQPHQYPEQLDNEPTHRACRALPWRLAHPPLAILPYAVHMVLAHRLCPRCRRRPVLLLGAPSEEHEHRCVSVFGSVLVS